MEILIAEDNATSRKMLEVTLKRWNFDVVIAGDGTEAWRLINQQNAPLMMILDWMMPGMDGVEICRKIRKEQPERIKYIILLTTRDDMNDVVEGLQSGADDYVTKPFDKNELRARIMVGMRELKLKSDLKTKIAELEDAMKHIKQLQGIIPICMHCHKIRDEEDVWQRFEGYISEHSDAMFSHGLCPECKTKYYSDIFDGSEEE